MNTLSIVVAIIIIICIMIILMMIILMMIIIIRVGKCQIFYTDQNLQTRLYPEKSA